MSRRHWRLDGRVPPGTAPQRDELHAQLEREHRDMLDRMDPRMIDRMRERQEREHRERLDEIHREFEAACQRDRDAMNAALEFTQIPAGTVFH